MRVLVLRGSSALMKSACVTTAQLDLDRTQGKRDSREYAKLRIFMFLVPLLECIEYHCHLQPTASRREVIALSQQGAVNSQSLIVGTITAAAFSEGVL
jgi:hypothetical protein